MHVFLFNFVILYDFLGVLSRNHHKILWFEQGA